MCGHSKKKKRDEKEKGIEEEGYILLSEYSDEETLYYEYEDEYICMIFMESTFYRISGNLAIEEIVKVREGLGGFK